MSGLMCAWCRRRIAHGYQFTDVGTRVGEAAADLVPEDAVRLGQRRYAVAGVVGSDDHVDDRVVTAAAPVTTSPIRPTFRSSSSVSCAPRRSIPSSVAANSWLLRASRRPSRRKKPRRMPYVGTTSRLPAASAWQRKRLQRVVRRHENRVGGGEDLEVQETVVAALAAVEVRDETPKRAISSPSAGNALSSPSGTSIAICSIASQPWR